MITQAELDAIRALVCGLSQSFTTRMHDRFASADPCMSILGFAWSQATRSPPALPLDQQRALQRQQADEASLKLAGTLKVRLSQPRASSRFRALCRRSTLMTAPVRVQAARAAKEQARQQRITDAEAALRQVSADMAIQPWQASPLQLDYQTAEASSFAAAGRPVERNPLRNTLTCAPCLLSSRLALHSTGRSPLGFVVRRTAAEPAMCSLLTKDGRTAGISQA